MQRTIVLFCLPALLLALAATAMHAAPTAAKLQPRRLLLVLPFENRSGQASLNWIGEAAPEVLNRRLASAGYLPISREDRLYALDHLGLPKNFQPSRAGTIRLAQTLDADYVVVGRFSTLDSTQARRITVEARVIDTGTLHMSAPIEEQADMKDLIEVLDRLAWRVTRQIDPGFPVAEQTFQTADAHLPIGVFEDYIRGLISPDPEDGIRRLKEAVRLDPHFSPALVAMGKAYFENEQYELAATTLGRLPADDPEAREADFYRGLAFIYAGGYAKAEDAFAFVARQLPLPEVLNNEGVARSRRGQDASDLFRQAAAGDPSDADYEFNLGVSLARKKDLANALQAIRQSLKLNPHDAEAKSFEAILAGRVGAARRSPPSTQGPASGTAVLAGLPADSIPLERVKRTFNEAAFRQLAAEIEQMEAARLASLPPPARAAALTEEGTRMLDKGLMLEAERQFQAALHADSSDAGAHAGLAAVRENAGDTAGARQQAEESLKLKPNVSAYLTLARLDLAENQLSSANGNVNLALKMQPKNSSALGLKQRIEAKLQPAPAR